MEGVFNLLEKKILLRFLDHYLNAAGLLITDEC